MKQLLKTMTAVALLGLPLTANAQTENPRGIYKMTTLTGRMGEVNAPFDQYKICTDSVTLMLNVQNAFFQLAETDHRVMNYTGDQPRDEGDHSTLIYDSNAEHFTLKWWHEGTGHIYFPDNDWCVERYESGRYSEVGKIAFDALTGTSAVDARNPLTGTWRIIGYVDELLDVKKALPKLHEQYPRSRYFNSFQVFTPTHWTMIGGSNAARAVGAGVVDKVEYDGRKSYKVGNTTRRVKWLSKDRIAVEEHIDYRTDWMILERVADGITPLSRIASQHLSTGKAKR